jgi:hypothetical protein
MTTESAWAAREAQVIREVLERAELCLQARAAAAEPGQALPAAVFPHPDAARSGRAER